MPESTRPPAGVAPSARLESIATFARPSSNRQYTFPGAPALAPAGLRGARSDDGSERSPAFANYDGRGNRQVDDRGGLDAAIATIEHRIDLVREARVDLVPGSQWQVG